MKKKLMPILVAVAFVLVICAIALGTAVIEKYTPGTDQTDLEAYYKLTAEGGLAIVMDGEILEENALLLDGHVYLDYEFFHEALNARFYWDSSENILRYVTASQVISVDAGTKAYTVTKTEYTTDYTIVKVDGDNMYLAVEFLALYTDMTYFVETNPDRLVITTQWGEIETATLKKDSPIRILGGIKSEIVTELEKGTKVQILEAMEEWSKVMTEDGLIGYLKNSVLGTTQTETVSSSFEEEAYTHILKSDMINLVWHQVTNQSANSNVSSLLSSTKGVNVISPTWFYLNDDEGNIGSLASTVYVTYCHQNGIEVWAILSNLENSSVDTTAVLSHTSSRDRLVKQIVAAAIEYDLDGINIDFEALEYAAAEGFIEFIRELSIKCKNNGIILSVDNYVPSSYTAFYNRSEQALYADYVVIMAYDEHYNGSEEGSVASIGFVTEGVLNTLEEVPAEQVILGMPFYTRAWALTPKDETQISEQEKASEDYVSYTISSSAIGMSEAERRISANGATKVWSEEDGQYYVEYVKDGVTYKIWLEDEASMELRLQLLKEQSLAGGAFWRLGLEKSSIWDTIIKYIN